MSLNLLPLVVCIISEENVLGEVGRGVYVLMSGLDYERLILAAGPVGYEIILIHRLMQCAMDHVLPYVHERKQFNKPIGQFQVT